MSSNTSGSGGLQTQKNESWTLTLLPASSGNGQPATFALFTFCGHLKDAAICVIICVLVPLELLPLQRPSAPCGCAWLLCCCGWSQEDAQKGPTPPSWSSTPPWTSMRNCTLGRWCLSTLSRKVRSSTQVFTWNLFFVDSIYSVSVCSLSLQCLRPSLSSWWSWRCLLKLCTTMAYWSAR